MKTAAKIVLKNEQNEKVFGEGPCLLLREIEKTGSLNAAARSMGMAYSKAHRVIRTAEEALGFPLTVKTTGGRSGGGSTLTSEGQLFLQRFEEYMTACNESIQVLYKKHFPEYTDGRDGYGENREAEEEKRQPYFQRTGLVIMASGEGKRFGSNKLLADFDGEPLIQRILDASEGVFEKRVVVTRHREVEQLCRKQGIPVIIHEYSGRNDTIRLGVEYMEERVETCIFTPADQPLLTRDTLIRIGQAAEKDRDNIYRTAWEKIRSTPTAFPAWTFRYLKDLPEGQGGSVLLKEYPEHVRKIAAGSEWELKDVDTIEDLEELLSIWKTLYSAKEAAAPPSSGQEP
ncbi:MAG: NTP transferase domain-containing protein [Lachnospiraceae bacterium]|nr:NTP transferase domain-containing protein [Lachnospiraceae bacterium]